MSETKNKMWIRNYVTMVVNEVKDMSAEERDSIPFRKAMVVKHQTFFSKFPRLLMLVLDSAQDFDFERLDEMLALMDSVQRGEQKYEEVNRRIGQEYFDKYVAPNIDTNKEDKEK